MTRYLPILMKTELFKGVSQADIAAMLSCLQAQKQSYLKGAYVLRQGQRVNRLSVPVEGSLHIQRDDYWGRRSIVSVVEVGDMFAEAYAAAGSGALPIDVVAMQPSVVLHFDVQKILTVCSSACRFHAMVVQNLFYAIAAQNRKLVEKLGYMQNRTTREKLMSYLSSQSSEQQSATFAIPLNRQQLADYLSVDRSAMCSELGKMRRDGLLTFQKNRFTLLGARARE